ncbi:MAG: Phenylacetic acid catabolic protein [Acidobacteriota bacterium]
MARLATFDDWVDTFRQWQKDIGLDFPGLKDYQFETKFGDTRSSEVEFGAYAGQRKWERVLQIPEQRTRDMLLNLIIYQGDTEFASVEQQRNLFNTAPNQQDLMSLIRIMLEEMRHGWQMCNLLVTYYGHSGKVEAYKMLDRRAFESNRLLGSFNEIIANWLDFFSYAEFVDRDGKFQLKMLSHSGFAPLARSMPPMLKEEAYHLGTGNNGLLRMIKAGKIPPWLIQKYFNKWISTALDLFGTDHSSSAHWGYTWGLKGRFNEDSAGVSADTDHLNEMARGLYYQEALGLIERMNKLIPDTSQHLRVPDYRFNRKIGEFAGQRFNVDGSRQFAAGEEFEAYLQQTLPTLDDARVFSELAAGGDWIVPRS